MVITIYVVVKVLVMEVFVSPFTTSTLFNDIAKTETVYFNFYGLTLMTLLTDLLYERFQIELTDSNPG